MEAMINYLCIYQGYSRKGAALTYLGRLREARATYQQGLEVDSNNQQLKDGLADVEAKIKGNDNLL